MATNHPLIHPMTTIRPASARAIAVMRTADPPVTDPVPLGVQDSETRAPPIPATKVIATRDSEPAKTQIATPEVQTMAVVRREELGSGTRQEIMAMTVRMVSCFARLFVYLLAY
jgi:hypothetical protein